MVIVRPHKATHAVLVTPTGKKATVQIADLDTLEGVAGKITWIRLSNKEREILGTVQFDGQIEEITSDYRKRKK